jgi:hypothetical protein
MMVGGIDIKLRQKNILLRIIRIISLFTLTLITCAAAIAAPSGPGTVTTVSSSRFGSVPGYNLSAIAGNVTELSINGTTITQTWQGYFGNITGKIVLGNANNQTFYDWNLASPRGEIYATRTSSVPSWANVRCANFTNVNSEDAALGVNQANDADSVNRTFLNTTDFTSFYVGSVLINNALGCYGTRMYNATGVKSSTTFAEVLLHDNTNLIYTALLDQNALGFDNRNHDFEMLVGENGHSGDSTVTPYYFYLELE